MSSPHSSFRTPGGPVPAGSLPLRQPLALRTALLAAAGLTALVAAAAGGIALARTTDPHGRSDAVTVGFLQDMSTHHAQAVEMSSTVYRRATDPSVSYLAFDILTSQQGQIGTMSGWLNRLGATPTHTGPAMTWMGQAHSGTMPGMATREQIAALATLPVPEMEEQFLRLMIDHHAGALDMSDYAAQHADDSRTRDLAEKMSQGQASEIEFMQSLLTGRGVPGQVPATGSHTMPAPTPMPGTSSSAPSPTATSHHG